MKSKKPQENEKNDFLDAIKDVKPLKPHNLAERKSAARPSSIRRPVAPGPELNEHEDDQFAFRRSGISQNDLRKLRNGQIPIENELDLHGSSVRQAEEKLRLFLYRAHSLRYRAVRVIHGKGSHSAGGAPVLRNKVTDWLRQSETVLAFCHAGPAEGGDGALCVLLKRRPIS